MSLKEIWADQVPEWFAKFNPPTIADGKVFRPVFARYQVPNPDNGAAPTMIAPGKIIVYGLFTGTHRPGQPGLPLQWRRWRGGEDPTPQFTIEQRWKMHGGVGALTQPTGDEMALGDAQGGRPRRGIDPGGRRPDLPSTSTAAGASGRVDLLVTRHWGAHRPGGNPRRIPPERSAGERTWLPGLR